jgi:hypothetical protein
LDHSVGGPWAATLGQPAVDIGRSMLMGADDAAAAVDREKNRDPGV